MGSATPALSRPPPDLTDLKARYLAAQLRGDRREALRLVIDEGLLRGAGVRDLQLAVIQEAQRDIGKLWQENAISVADEHLATAISNMILAHLYDRAERAPSNGKHVLIACVEGELHDMPSRLVADTLDLGGFEVSYLGASVPTDSLIAFIKAQEPDLIALSATMAFHATALRAAVARIREVSSIPIIVGGGACSWARSLASDVRAEGTASDAAEALAVARRLLGVAA